MDGRVLVTNVGFDADRQLLIYDQIMPVNSSKGEWITPANVMNFLKDAPKQLTMRVNSAGGEVSAGLAIYNALREHGNVTAIIDGYAMSTAGWLTLAADHREICQNALFMAHNPYMLEEIGSLQAIQDVTNRWTAHKSAIRNIFTSRTNMSETEVDAMMDATTYLSADETVQKGICHTVRNGTPKTDVLNCLNIPAEALAKTVIPSAVHNLNDIRARRAKLLARKQI
jgi:ATP-dependent protease ClpP protease subunit